MLAAAVLLIGIGIATIYAVGHPAEDSPAGQTEDLAVYWKKQVGFAFVGLVGFVIVNLINYRWWGTASYWILGVVIVLLALLLVSKLLPTPLPFAKPKVGTYRWIWITVAGRDLPSLQPSEFCKVAYIMALAWYLRFRSNYGSFKALVGPFALALLPMVLILPEPDLGT
ncbi:MAG: FtsW/RodA/SpoVE family cell cycle protein, partial [Planctomycetota bacterium]